MARYVGLRQGKVHESHVISEYYCGGCGYPVTDHDSFCPECGGAFHECDSKPFIAKMAVPKEMRTDYGMMVTANLLMACSIETLKRKNEELEAKLRELGIEVEECTRQP